MAHIPRKLVIYILCHIGNYLQGENLKLAIKDKYFDHKLELAHLCDYYSQFLIASFYSPRMS